MKLRFLALATLVLLIAGFYSCSKNDAVQSATGIPQQVIDRVHDLGFQTDNIIEADGGYIVENDIFLSKEDLDHADVDHILRVGDEEQYRTTNLVTGLPRTIKVSLSSTLNNLAGYPAALTEAVNRYNAQNLQITFQVVTSNANISITKAPNGAGYLASAGFPTSGGNPFNSVKVNSNAIGSGSSTTFINYLATILAHEMGHCIGFRHTDYMSRQYSCGGAPYNEGASTVGAVHIPGTPTDPDANSWMLACIGANQNRPFNVNDVTALNYLY